MQEKASRECRTFCSAPCNFRRKDWKEWLFYNIPSQDLSQQMNSDDCGVFVLKWAQHIALGFPLDFTQNDIESFRYSMILEICARDPRL